MNLDMDQQTQSNNQTEPCPQGEGQWVAPPAPGLGPTLVVRHRRNSQLPVSIPKPKPYPAFPTHAAAETDDRAQKITATQAEAQRRLEQQFAGTTPQGRHIIRMKLFDLKRALRQTEQTMLHEMAIIQSLVPQPIQRLISENRACLPQDEIRSQAARYLRTTGCTVLYLATLERLSAAYDPIQQMPQHKDKVAMITFFRAVADLLPPCGQDANPRPTLRTSGNLASRDSSTIPPPVPTAQASSRASCHLPFT